jgi:hypothetical protein
LVLRVQSYSSWVTTTTTLSSTIEPFNVTNTRPSLNPSSKRDTPTMAAEVASPGGADFFFKGESGRNTRGLLRLIILCTIAAAAVASRLFSVIRFESIIHECKLIDVP